MPKDAKWFKSAPSKAIENSQLDRNTGEIKNVILCQVGPAKGHGVHLDQDFIDSVIDYADENYSEKNPLKCRFGHPSMSHTTMGKQLGTFTNFRKVGEKAIADLQLLQAARSGPNGNMWDWMFDMAEERPDFVMNSIVFQPGEYYKIIKGKKKKQSDFDRPYDFNSAESDDKKVYVEMKKLMFSDIVEQGAATESLFSANFNKDKFAVIATEFLNEHPEIDLFIKEHPEKLYTLLKQRGITLEKTSLFKSLTDLIGGKPDAKLIEKLENEALGRQQAEGLLNDANTQIEAFKAKVEELEADAIALNTEIDRLNKLTILNDASQFKKEIPLKEGAKPSWHKDNFKK
jgi:hypothetical protein